MRFLPGVIALLAVVFCLAPARSSHADFPIPIPMSAVGGVVSNVDTGLPVEGVRVALFARGGGLVFVQQTDENGVFVFDDLPIGSYVLTVQGGESTPIFAGPLAYFYMLTTSL